MRQIIIYILFSSLLISCYPTRYGLCTLVGSRATVGCMGEEAYDKLMNPKSMVEYWEHPSQPSTDVEQRLQDWRDCGGNNVGHLGYHPSMLQPGESEDQAYDRRSAEIQRCMLKIGYKYTGSCTSDFSKATPACGAP